MLLRAVRTKNLANQKFSFTLIQSKLSAPKTCYQDFPWSYLSNCNVLMVNQAHQCSSETDLSDLVQLSYLLIEGLWIFLIVSTDHLERRETELTFPGIIQKVVHV